MIYHPIKHWKRAGNITLGALSQVSDVALACFDPCLLVLPDSGAMTLEDSEGLVFV